MSFERFTPLNVLSNDKKYFLDLLAEMDQINKLGSPEERQKRLFTYNPKIQSSIYEDVHAKIFEKKNDFAQPSQETELVEIPESDSDATVSENEEIENQEEPHRE